MIGITLPENREIGSIYHIFVSCFLSKLIHIQAFVDFINGKLMSGDSSSSTFHDFQEFIVSNYQKFRNSKFQSFKVSKIQSFKDSKIPWI